MHLVVCQSWFFFPSADYGNLTKCLKFHEIEELNVVMTESTLLWQLGWRQWQHSHFQDSWLKSKTWSNFQVPEEGWQVCSPLEVYRVKLRSSAVFPRSLVVKDAPWRKAERERVGWTVFLLCDMWFFSTSNYLRVFHLLHILSYFFSWISTK